MRLGTSGWSYPHWRRLLYPEGLAQTRWLPRYAEVFTTVELNATFYRLPTEKAVDRWREQTPRGFLFACKGSRYLTHTRKLRDVGQGLERFFAPLRRLGPKLGPVLWQLPPNWKTANPVRLERFLQALPSDVRHVFEFRAIAWYDEPILELLDRYGAAICEHDLLPELPPHSTGDFRYLRFHGTSARYGGRYGKEAMEEVALELRDTGRDAYVFFNNDRKGAALLDALDLSELLGEPLPHAEEVREEA
ncbi:hypothetical protein AKJ08_2592 [Vulgatibacter incomptus]|uniref:DUF72 domain-containing protein n=1 Tax=Vulgatibacter incomptus TaxID=1391653 RepID=A0A0K1PFC2_9BACT|nr:hypothetical protein AKJ08_2592 [Vulgatibacter incomptus]